MPFQKLDVHVGIGVVPHVADFFTVVLMPPPGQACSVAELFARCAASAAPFQRDARRSSATSAMLGRQDPPTRCAMLHSLARVSRCSPCLPRPSRVCAR